MKTKTIAIVDPASYSLPYDYWYIIELSKYYKIDFYYSKTKYNYEYIKLLQKNSNITLQEYSISYGNKLAGLKNYSVMLQKIYDKKSEYMVIHFFWSIFFPLEYIYFLLFKNKLFYTFHNDVPHNKKKKKHYPNQIIHNIAKKSIFVSDFTKSRFEKNYKILNPILTIQHGLLPINISNDSINRNSKTNTKEKELVFWGLVRKYKGVDLFLNDKILLKVQIFGRWDKSLEDLKQKLVIKENIVIVDRFIDDDEIIELMINDNIFVLPYINATQSGVAYTLLEYSKVFVCSNVGETFQFLKENNLEELSFDRSSVDDFNRAYRYANINYEKIKQKLTKIKEKYKWNIIMKDIKDLYEN